MKQLIKASELELILEQSLKEAYDRLQDAKDDYQNAFDDLEAFETESYDDDEEVELE